MLTSLLLRGRSRCCICVKSSKSFLRISGDGFDCRPCDIERYCSYKANSSESSILDVPLMENSGALDARLVTMPDDVDDGDDNERLFDVGVLRYIDDVDDGTTSGVASKRDVRPVIDGC